MLVRTTKPGHLIKIGDDVEVVIVRRKGANGFVVGVQAPRGVPVVFTDDLLDTSELEAEDTHIAGPKD